MDSGQAQGMAMMMVDGLEREQKTTRRVLAAIPENQLDFKLGEKGRTARELAWHLLASEIWFADSILAGDFNRPEAELPANASVTTLLEYYDSHLAGKFDKLKGLSGDHYAKVVDFMGVMKMPTVVFLGFWNSHSVHHRGQLSAYLRAMNAHVPSIYGGSADEPFQMPATA